MGEGEPHIHYYCDESSQTAAPWLALGGVAIDSRMLPTIEGQLARLKVKAGRTGEVKWDNANSYGGVIQRSYIDYLFALIARGQVHFHIRFSEMKVYAHSLSGRRRRVGTVSKQYYQFLLYRALKFYGGLGPLHVFPDDGECTIELPGYLEALRRAELRVFKRPGPSRLVEIVQRSSAKEPMLQLLDVTLGALAAYRNSRHLAEDANEVKRSLAEYAFKRTGWHSISTTNSDGIFHLNRWNAKPTLSAAEARAAANSLRSNSHK